MAKIAALALSVSVLSGCLIMVPGHLYPVQGPLSTLTPAPIYTVVINGVGNSGTVSTTLGTRPLTGSWSVLRPDDPSANSMAAEWDRVYGNGFFTANVLGTPLLARGALAGKGDATLTVQFIDVPGDALAHARGVAADNAGNVYKLTFQ
jgi:hypothetical protein